MNSSAVIGLFFDQMSFPPFQSKSTSFQGAVHVGSTGPVLLQIMIIVEFGKNQDCGKEEEEDEEEEDDFKKKGEDIVIPVAIRRHDVML